MAADHRFRRRHGGHERQLLSGSRATAPRRRRGYRVPRAACARGGPLAPHSRSHLRRCRGCRNGVAGHRIDPGRRGHRPDRCRVGAAGRDVLGLLHPHQRTGRRCGPRSGRPGHGARGRSGHLGSAGGERSGRGRRRSRAADRGLGGRRAGIGHSLRSGVPGAAAPAQVRVRSAHQPRARRGDARGLGTARTGGRTSPPDGCGPRHRRECRLGHRIPPSGRSRAARPAGAHRADHPSRARRARIR